jgi:2-keto-4-pentenoate hydratase/2-oxohepta-3-ene-1,7-dioic acid hydratase in catechol pathway
MKFCRFQPAEFPAGNVGKTESRQYPAPLCGIIRGEEVRTIAGDIFGAWEEAGPVWPVQEVTLLPPVAPGKIICVGRNYPEHAAELGNAVPKEPLIFLKPPSSVIGPGEPIVLPRISRRVDYEGEIAVIVGRTCYLPSASEDVRRYIAGYTCLNDVTARDLQKTDVQFTRPKGFDTFCPLGPVMETDFDLNVATVETGVNGQRKQFGCAADMLFSLDVIMRWIAQVMTLVPGDVIALGTPPGVGPLAAGDLVEVSVAGIGTLSNPVMALEN